jgi:hypothetical protein
MKNIIQSQRTGQNPNSFGEPTILRGNLKKLFILTWLILGFASFTA